MEMRGTLIFLLAVFTLVSCKKAEDRACLKFNGDEIIRKIPISQGVDSLFLNDDLFYTLVPSTESKVVLRGGENMLNHIDIVSGNGKLTVSNHNKCRFLRSYKHKIFAEIHVDGITFIEFFGSRELKSEGKLLSNELRIHVRDGAGELDLEIENGYTSVVYGSGYGNFFLRGEVLHCYIHCNSNTYGDTRNLLVKESLKVVSNTAGNVWVNADSTHFSADILYKGNVGYVGTPITTDVTIQGKGKLINLN